MVERCEKQTWQIGKQELKSNMMRFDLTSGLRAKDILEFVCCCLFVPFTIRRYSSFSVFLFRGYHVFNKGIHSALVKLVKFNPRKNNWNIPGKFHFLWGGYLVPRGVLSPETPAWYIFGFFGSIEVPTKMPLVGTERFLAKNYLSQYLKSSTLW